MCLARMSLEAAIWLLIASKTLLARFSTHPGMGTLMSHRVHGDNADECLATIQREAQTFRKTRSADLIPTATSARINRSAGLKCETVSPETIEVLSGQSNFFPFFPDCFDVTIAPLVSLWKNNAGDYHSTCSSRYEMALAFVDASEFL